ncbi:MAG: hypothetical protein AB7R55_04635 [Gemmatimonadales bacterium]
MSRALTLLVMLLSLVSAAPAQGLPDAWWTDSTEARLALADQLVESGATFDPLYRALAAGRPRWPDAPVGRLERTRRNRDGQSFAYQVLVPKDYDPAKRHPVRVYLHGGVARREPGRWRDPERVARPGELAVFPSAWADALWWDWSQVENLHGILVDLKREYNVDENRVYLVGVSDGATGAYYQAFKAPTIWAGFVCLIGHPAVLSNPRFAESGEIFARNLSHQALFVANATDDRLYPTRTVAPFVGLFERVGAAVTFRDKPGDHGVAWWPEEAERIERFVSEHPRAPLPDTLDWETESVTRGNRVAWLRIDRLASEPARRDPLADDPFPHFQPTGRVRLERAGNRIALTSYNVAALTLLLAPDRLAFDRPLELVVNGHPAVRVPLEPSVRTLLTWAARDVDRTMLFGAELEVRIAADGAATVGLRR